jgi:hypothetical protein
MDLKPIGKIVEAENYIEESLISTIKGTFVKLKRLASNKDKANLEKLVRENSFQGYVDDIEEDIELIDSRREAVASMNRIEYLIQYINNYVESIEGRINAENTTRYEKESLTKIKSTTNSFKNQLHSLQKKVKAKMEQYK